MAETVVPCCATAPVELIAFVTPVLPSPERTTAGPALMLPLRVTSAKAAGAANADPTANAIRVLFIPSPWLRRSVCIPDAGFGDPPLQGARFLFLLPRCGGGEAILPKCDT